jgi:hypothetical protein
MIMGITICRIIVCVILGWGIVYDLAQTVTSKSLTGSKAVERFTSWLIYASAIYLILN